jgi:hypothetical protein
LPEHVFWLGAQTPAHAPDTHVWFVHAVAVPYWPLDWQVSTPLPEHVVWLGAHTPWQLPPMHVWLVHADADPHCPLDWHV